MHTFRYKSGHIHVNFMENTVRVQLGYELTWVKSVHAAKIFITRKEQT